MKLLEEMTHYDLLEIRPDASREEVERAYRMARETWSEGSLAAYSLYEEEDAAALREGVERAWRVLGDPERRREYDAELEATGRAREAGEGFGAPRAEGPQAEPAPLLEAEAGAVRRLGSASPPFGDLEDAEEEGEAFDGPRLRRVRLRRGLEIEHVAGVTKVNPAYLRFIEDEQFSDLPAPVYVRGFVTAYARCVGLDPQRVLPDYMRRFREARRTPARLRALGRR